MIYHNNDVKNPLWIDDSYEIVLDCKTNSIRLILPTLYPISLSIKKQLHTIHRSLQIDYGHFMEEYPEQLMSMMNLQSIHIIVSTFSTKIFILFVDFRSHVGQ